MVSCCCFRLLLSLLSLTKLKATVLLVIGQEIIMGQNIVPEETCSRFRNGMGG